MAINQFIVILCFILCSSYAQIFQNSTFNYIMQSGSSLNNYTYTLNSLGTGLFAFTAPFGSGPSGGVKYSAGPNSEQPDHLNLWEYDLGQNTYGKYPAASNAYVGEVAIGAYNNNSGTNVLTKENFLAITMLNFTAYSVGQNCSFQWYFEYAINLTETPESIRSSVVYPCINTGNGMWTVHVEGINITGYSEVIMAGVTIYLTNPPNITKMTSGSIIGTAHMTTSGSGSQLPPSSASSTSTSIIMSTTATATTTTSEISPSTSATQEASLSTNTLVQSSNSIVNVSNMLVVLFGVLYCFFL